MTLYFYLAKRFMFSVFRVQLAIFILMLLLVATEQTRILSERGVDATTTLKMIALQMPSGLTLTFPLVMLLGSLFTFLGLSRSSELVVVRAAGTSALRVLLAPVVLTLVIGAIGLAAINPIVAATIRKYDEINSSLSKNDFNRLSISGDGLWLRQETENSQFVIQARSSSRNGNTLVDVRFHEFSVDGILLRRIEAAWANLELGEWVLGDATQWRFFSQEDSENRDISHFAEIQIPTSLTSDGILESFAQPESISIWRLPSFITQLEASGFSAIQHQLFLQTQFAAEKGDVIIG